MRSVVLIEQIVEQRHRSRVLLFHSVGIAQPHCIFTANPPPFLLLVKAALDVRHSMDQRTTTSRSSVQRVLILDDNSDSACILAMLSKRMGYEAAFALNGEEGLRVGETFEPHVVLVDLKMPLMDGYEICRRMRALPWGAKARIVAHTGCTHQQDYCQARDAGFDGFLVKPIAKEAMAKLFEADYEHRWTGKPL